MYSLMRKSNSSEEDATCDLLQKMLIYENEDFHVEMMKYKEIETFKIMDLPDISTRVKPYLALVCNDGYVAFVEVESETYVRTIRKLFFVLMLHLMKVKIILEESSISEVKGNN